MQRRINKLSWLFPHANRLGAGLHMTINTTYTGMKQPMANRINTLVVPSKL